MATRRTLILPMIADFYGLAAMIPDYDFDYDFHMIYMMAMIGQR